MDFISPPRGIERIDLRDVPVVVAVAGRGGGDKALAVGRPVIFIDVHVRGRDLAQLAAWPRHTKARRCSVTASLITPVCAFSATSGPAARSAFSVNKKSDGFAVGRPARRGEKSFHAGELARRTARGAGDIELLLPGFAGIGEKGDLFAVRRPCHSRFQIVRRQ